MKVESVQPKTGQSQVDYGMNKSSKAVHKNRSPYKILLKVRLADPSFIPGCSTRNDPIPNKEPSVASKILTSLRSEDILVLT